jgi:hypothetical protein
MAAHGVRTMSAPAGRKGSLRLRELASSQSRDWYETFREFMARCVRGGPRKHVATLREGESPFEGSMRPSSAPCRALRRMEPAVRSRRIQISKCFNSAPPRSALQHASIPLQRPPDSRHFAACCVERGRSASVLRFRSVWSVPSALPGPLEPCEGAVLPLRRMERMGRAASAYPRCRAVAVAHGRDPADPRIRGSPDHWITGSLDPWIGASPDHRISGSRAVGGDPCYGQAGARRAHNEDSRKAIGRQRAQRGGEAICRRLGVS